jgi:hypothetical protein
LVGNRSVVDRHGLRGVNLSPGMQVTLEVQSLRSFRSAGCLVPETFYMRPIPPERAQLYETQLTYLGPR